MNMTQNHDDDGWEQWTLTLDAEDRARIEREHGLSSGTVDESYMFHGMTEWGDGPVLTDWYWGAPSLFPIMLAIAEAERTRIMAARWEDSARSWAEANGYDLVSRDARPPAVVLHYDADGHLDLLLTEGVTVLWVCEATPGDRVYRAHANTLHAEIDALIGDSPIGHTDDERQVQLREIVGVDAKEGAN